MPTARPSLRVRLLGAGLVAALALGVAGCGGEPSNDDLRAALVSSGIPSVEADCAVTAIDGVLSDDEVRELIERGNGGAPVDDLERPDDKLDQLRSALGACRDAAQGSLVTPPEPTDPTGGSQPTVTIPIGGVVTTDGASLDTVPDVEESTTSAPSGAGD